MYKHMGDTLATTKDTSAESHPTAFHSPDPSLSGSPGHCPTPPWKQTISNVHLTECIRGEKRNTKHKLNGFHRIGFLYSYKGRIDYGYF